MFMPVYSRGGDTEKERLIAEAKEYGVEKASFLSILREARQEWLFLAIGILAAIVDGAISPIFSQMYSQIFSVCSASAALCIAFVLRHSRKKAKN
jgi:hypothetical protein